MAKKSLEKGALDELFKKVNRIEKYIVGNLNRQPRSSNIFSSSIPKGFETPEETIRHFEEEIQKLKFVGMKLENWFREYKETQLTHREIAENTRQNYRNLSINELYVVFKPINPSSREPYTLRNVRTMINNSSIMHSIARSHSDLFSPNDFKRFLRETNVNYDEEIADILLQFIELNGNDLTPSQLKIQLGMKRSEIVKLRERKKKEEEKGKKKK